MLQTKYQTSFQRFIVRKRGNCSESDETVDPNISWAKEMLREFDYPNFVLVQPEEVQDEDMYNTNPNNTEIIVGNAGKHDKEWFHNI